MSGTGATDGFNLHIAENLSKKNKCKQAKLTMNECTIVTKAEAVMEGYTVLVRSNMIGQSWQGQGVFLWEWTLQLRCQVWLVITLWKRKVVHFRSEGPAGNGCGQGDPFHPSILSILSFLPLSFLVISWQSPQLQVQSLYSSKEIGGRGQQLVLSLLPVIKLAPEVPLQVSFSTIGQTLVAKSLMKRDRIDGILRIV